jgi:hypothetical protein
MYRDVPPDWSFFVVVDVTVNTYNSKKGKSNTWMMM